MEKSKEKSNKSRLAGPLSKKVKFTKNEDMKLKYLIDKYSTKDWEKIAEHLPPRTARQCRDRWTNYIDPNLSQEPWSHDEDNVLLEMHEKYGNHWKKIGKYLPKRSKNNIKNRWSVLKKIFNENEIIENRSISNITIQEQSIINPQGSVVSAPSNTFISTNISQPTIPPVVTTATTVFVPVVQVFVPVPSQIENYSNRIPIYSENIPQYYQEVIEQPINNYVQPLYQENYVPIIEKNIY
ncbi:hypothetical protein M9Y10_039895 [Tritrichomonas musculus]|uniref:Myb-like DNA-binding domain containing protein n=1 Tax=Tritrichomonas musculus TaxID=1915356 RepID=A0ABR2GQP2_9EUKA